MKKTAASILPGLASFLLLALGSGSGCNSAPTPESVGDAPQSSAVGNAATAPPRDPSSPSSASKSNPLRGASSAGDEPPPVPPVIPAFANVAQDLGVDFTHFSDPVPGRFFLPEVMGSGVAWFDFDLDGFLDLFFGNGCELEGPVQPGSHLSRLFRNGMAAGSDRGFRDVTNAAAGWDGRYVQGCAVGDFDSDGFPDLFLACFGADTLLHNNGDGTFSTVTNSAGTTDDLWSTSAAWFDADADGDLDLYVVNYLDVTLANKQVCQYNGRPGYCGPGQYKAVPDRLWINQGDGTFLDQLDAYGMSVESGKGLAITVADFDHDLHPEIYVANDMDANLLFTRGDSPLAASPSDETPKPWVEVGALAGCAVSGMGLNEASMGISCADFDGDGLPDLYLTHYFNAKNTFYRNLGGLSFQDDSFRTRVAATSFQSLGFGTVPLDFDRDGQTDLFLANGHVLGPEIPPYEMEPQLLWNQRSARFQDVTTLAGDYFRDKWLGRSAAGADFDNDGDIDLAVSHLLRPAALLRNNTRTERSYIGFDLRTRTRIPPVGGRIVVTAGDREFTQVVQAGGSYLATHDPRVLVGLGDTSTPVTATIHWPSGQTQRLTELAVNRYWTVYEGEPPREATVGVMAANSAVPVDSADLTSVTTATIPMTGGSRP